MAEILSKLNRYARAALEDRCVNRSQVSIPGMLRPQGQVAFPIRVTDISVAGFASEAITGIHPGKLCWLSVAGLHGRESRVIWNDGCHVGCEFTSLLNMAVVDNIIARNRRA